MNADLDDEYFDDLGMMDELLVDKSQQRAELNSLVAQFLANGGRIQQLDSAATGLERGYITHGQMTSIDKNNANIKKRAQERKRQLINTIRAALAVPENRRPSVAAICVKTGASVASIRALLIHEFTGDPRAEAMLNEGGKNKTRKLKKQIEEGGHGDI